MLNHVGDILNRKGPALNPKEGSDSAFLRLIKRLPHKRRRTIRDMRNITLQRCHQLDLFLMAERAPTPVGHRERLVEVLRVLVRNRRPRPVHGVDGCVDVREMAGCRGCHGEVGVPAGQTGDDGRKGVKGVDEACVVHVGGCRGRGSRGRGGVGIWRSE